MAKGYIYIFTNPSFKEWVKIGYADDWRDRLARLNHSSAVPFAFQAFATYEVSEKLTDIALHNLIDSLRPDLRSREKLDGGKTRVREFYAMSAEDAYNLLAAIAKISGTTERLTRIEQNAAEKKDDELSEEMKREARRGPFSFKDCNIKPGSVIQYIKNHKIEAVVVDDRHIRYGDEVMSVSALAKILLNSKYSVQGTIYFEYKGEVLDNLRNRLGK